MSNKALISVIVPVYNGERYLADCLGSVLSQCHRNLELIVVDDGSTDGTAAILEDLGKRDRRIRCLKADHGGASAARNAALDEARGEWVMFVDADDLLLSPCLLGAVAACGPEVDVVTFDTSSDPAELTGRSPTSAHDCAVARIHRTGEDQVLDPPRLAPMIVDESFNTVWNKAYRLGLIARAGCRFPVGIHLGEDLMFNLDYARDASRVRHLPITGYYYRRDNSESITTRFVPGKHSELMLVNDMLRRFAADLGSAEIAAAADYIRAKNAVSAARDLHHRQCTLTLREKLGAAQHYRRSAPRVDPRGLGSVRRLFGTVYNLTGHRTLFLLGGLLAAAGRRRRHDQGGDS